jgi:hypothetical protein
MRGVRAKHDLALRSASVTAVASPIFAAGPAGPPQLANAFGAYANYETAAR